MEVLAEGKGEGEKQPVQQGGLCVNRKGLHIIIERVELLPDGTYQGLAYQPGRLINGGLIPRHKETSAMSLLRGKRRKGGGKNLS